VAVSRCAWNVQLQQAFRADTISAAKPATAFLFNPISRQQLSGNVAWAVPN
jgi:hypothetical protein